MKLHFNTNRRLEFKLLQTISFQLIYFALLTNYTGATSDSVNPLFQCLEISVTFQGKTDVANWSEFSQIANREVSPDLTQGTPKKKNNNNNMPWFSPSIKVVLSRQITHTQSSNTPLSPDTRHPHLDFQKLHHFSVFPNRMHCVTASHPSPADNPPERRRVVRKNTEQSKNGRVKLNHLHMHKGSTLFSNFRALLRSLHQHHSALKATFTPSIQLSLGLPCAHPPLTSKTDSHENIFNGKIIKTRRISPTL